MLPLALCFCVLLADETATERRYDAGPLAVEDFQAPVPNPLPSVGRFKQFALADTDIRYQLNYQYRRTFTSTQATLQDIDIYAIFLTDKSWLAPEGKKALDHEQGHFDISQMYALDAMLQMRTRLHDGKTLVGEGTTKEEAIADLQTKVNDFLRPLRDRVATAQQEYDRETNHGLIAARQGAHRKRQLELLNELIADLKALESAGEDR